MSLLASWQTAGLLRPIDRHLAELVGRHGGAWEVQLAAAFASRALADGHTCLELAAPGRGLSRVEVEQGVPEVAWPAPAAWSAALVASSLVAPDVGPQPLVHRDGRVWLTRYASHEAALAAGLVRLARSSVAPVDEDALEASVQRLFGGTWANASQEDAVRQATRQGVTVLAGGPGSGKTTTVVRFLAALLEQAASAGRSLPRIRLLAPTGKAAARLADSVRFQKGTLSLAPGTAEAVRDAIPEQARTLHGALGPRNDFLTRVFHDADHPWAADVVVVDEASMVDLPLMARVIDAVKPGARLLLLGDPDQLAAVGAGAVLSDLCSGELGGAVGGGVVRLLGSRRFEEGGAVGILAKAIHEGDAAATRAALASDPSVRRHAVPGRLDRDAAFLAHAVEGYRAFCQAEGPAARLVALDTFRVLCAVRRGPAGVEALNVAIEAALRREGLLPPEAGMYPGRPILVTANDYGVRLFNGDVGVIDRDARGELRAFFADPSAPDGVRAVLPSRLPEHDSVFAMTVHKSQGSEVDEVSLALPQASSPLLSRELVYTAVTRAKERVLLWGDEAVLVAALGVQAERRSGLRAALARAEASVV